jgi:hypothetical protein
MNIRDVEKIMIRVSSRDLIHFLDSNKAPQFIIVIIMVDTITDFCKRVNMFWLNKNTGYSAFSTKNQPLLKNIVHFLIL